MAVSVSFLFIGTNFELASDSITLTITRSDSLHLDGHLSAFVQQAKPLPVGRHSVVTGQFRLTRFGT